MRSLTLILLGTSLLLATAQGVVLFQAASDAWTAPSGWTGPEAAYYKSFDSSEGMTLVNGAHLVDGKIGKAVITDADKLQYVDLGVISDQACIATPSTCTLGGAVSGWFKSVDGEDPGSLVSSMDGPQIGPVYHESILLSAQESYRASVQTKHQYLYVSAHDEVNKTDWFHITMVYHDDDTPLDLYVNGAKLDYNMPMSMAWEHQKNKGKVVIGITFTAEPTDKNNLRSIMADDVIFFNKALTDDDVMKLYKSYEEECTDSDAWTAPSGWTGPEAVYYKSFDNTECMTLVNGAKLASGKVGLAVTTDNNQRQYVDLGVIADQACLVTPSSCSSAGGSFSAWVKLIPSKTGKTYQFTLISSRDDYLYEKGNMIFYQGIEVNFQSKKNIVVLTSENHKSLVMTKFSPTLNEWYHLAIVYNRNTKRQQTYINGKIDYLSGSENSFNAAKNTGKVVIGRRFTEYHSKPKYFHYSSVAVDDMLFFNQQLTADQVKSLYDSYQ